MNKELISLLDDLYETYERDCYKKLKINITEESNENMQFNLFRYFFSLNDNVAREEQVGVVEKTKLIKVIHLIYPYWIAALLMDSDLAGYAASKRVIEYYVEFFEEYPASSVISV